MSVSISVSRLLNFAGRFRRISRYWLAGWRVDPTGSAAAAAVSSSSSLAAAAAAAAARTAAASGLLAAAEDEAAATGASRGCPDPLGRSAGFEKRFAAGC